MMFVQSLKGISHNKIEDTKIEHLELAVDAHGKACREDHRLDPRTTMKFVSVTPSH